jgi:hypothetical protein
MSIMFQHLNGRYQEDCYNKWSPVINATDDIKSEQTKIATALVLENTQRDFESQGMFSESAYGVQGGMNSYGSMDARGAQADVNAQGAAQDGGGTLGTVYNYGPKGGPDIGSVKNTQGDARIPSIVIPTVRRIFPNLLAHEVVGVQPMNGPVGFAFALRAQYGVHGKGKIDENGKEIGYNLVDSEFTGAEGNAPSGDASFWAAFAGDAAVQPLAEGQGANLNPSEWWKIDEDMPMAKFALSKGVVEAKARKLAAHYSLELQEDLKNMHGIDADTEMVNIISYEIQQEIDRQLMAEMVKAAINSGHTSTWTPVSADGRNQLERISTLYTQLLLKANVIATQTRRGPATFAIASTKVCALLERMKNNALDSAHGDVNTMSFGVANVGKLPNGMSLFRDTFAGGDYILLGYKGPTPYDSGIIYCPYIPMQIMRAIGEQDFSPRMGVRTRYGILDNQFGAGDYYHMMKIDGLTNFIDGSEQGRQFIF